MCQFACVAGDHLGDLFESVNAAVRPVNIRGLQVPVHNLVTGDFFIRKIAKSERRSLGKAVWADPSHAENLEDLNKENSKFLRKELNRGLTYASARQHPCLIWHDLDEWGSAKIACISVARFVSNH